jgi:hypothetical protein
MVVQDCKFCKLKFLKTAILFSLLPVFCKFCKTKTVFRQNLPPLSNLSLLQIFDLDNFAYLASKFLIYKLNV